MDTSIPKTRVCTRCGKRKKMDRFPQHRKAKYGKSERCKDCHRELTAKYRRENPEKVKAAIANWVSRNPVRAAAGQRQRNKRAWDRRRAWYQELKTGKTCKRCPENHPACLDFHHRDPTTKVAEISVMVRDGVARKIIMAEIAKCDLLCANCHRKEHYTEDSIRIPGLEGGRHSETDPRRFRPR